MDWLSRLSTFILADCHNINDINGRFCYRTVQLIQESDSMDEELSKLLALKLLNSQSKRSKMNESDIYFRNGISVLTLFDSSLRPPFHTVVLHSNTTDINLNIPNSAILLLKKLPQYVRIYTHFCN